MTLLIHTARFFYKPGETYPARDVGADRYFVLDPTPEGWKNGEYVVMKSDCEVMGETLNETEG